MLGIRHRISNGQVESWDGCDVFSNFTSHKYSFYLATGETPENLLRLTRTTRQLFLNETGRNYTLSPVNRVMLYMMWLRSYPPYHNLALMFNVNVDTVHNEINRCIPIIKRALYRFVQWPTINKWREKRGSWAKLESAVGAIDGTSTEIYRLEIEPQKLYFSGHRHVHAIHTQIVIDNDGYILRSGIFRSSK